MQTREGSEWNQAFLEATNKLLDDAGKLASERSQLLRSAVQRSPEEVQARPRRQQGIPQDSTCTSATMPPQPDGAAIPVWVRDGWEVEEKTVLNDARAAGDSAAIVYGFIPRKKAEELKQAIAGYYAATTTLQAKGHPGTPEGIEARKAMETRQEQAQRTRDSLINDILNETQVYLAGGDEPVGGTLLETEDPGRGQRLPGPALPRCSIRPTPAPTGTRSSTGPRRGRRRPGGGRAQGRPGEPPGLQGRPRFRRQRQEGDRGPQAVRQPAVRLAAGRHRRRPDRPVQRAGLIQARIGNEPSPRASSTRRTSPPPSSGSRHVTLTKAQLIAAPRAVQEGRAEHPAEPGVAARRRIPRPADEAGRDRRAAMPRCPSARHEPHHRHGQPGRQRPVEGDPRATRTDWPADRRLAARADLIAQRLAPLEAAGRPAEFAADLPVAAEVQPEVTAIEQNRRLLADPDPVPGMVEKLTEALRIGAQRAPRQLLERPTRTAHGVLEATPHLEAAHAGAALRRSSAQYGIRDHADDRRGHDRGNPRHASGTPS